MTQEVWWYVLAGLLIGFSLSTLWEWLYFRRKRMRIEQRQIAELEAQIDSLRQAPAPVQPPVDPVGSWSSTDYLPPGVLLESETGRIVVPAPAETTSPGIQPAAKAVLMSQAIAAYRAGQNGSENDSGREPVPSAAVIVAASAMDPAAEVTTTGDPSRAEAASPPESDSKTTPVPLAPAAIGDAPEPIDELFAALEQIIASMGNRYPDLLAANTAQAPVGASRSESYTAVEVVKVESRTE